MLLTVLCVPGCPNVKLLVDGLHRALSVDPAGLQVLEIDDEDTAERWGMTGSPTLLVNGRDPFGTQTAPALSCRLFHAGDGTVSGAPSVTQLEHALATVQQPAPPEPAELDLLGRGGQGRLAPSEGGLRAVQRAVLAAIVVDGSAPTAAELDTVATPYGRTGAQILRALAEEDFLTLDAGGQIRAAYPFSVPVTAHRVTPDSGCAVWAMCAVDALGIPAMLGQPVRIDTADPLTGDVLTFRVGADGDIDGPPGAVVLLGRRRSVAASAEQRCCASVNFFGSRHSAARWFALQPEIDGEILELDDAARLGRAIFGRLLSQ